MLSLSSKETLGNKQKLVATSFTTAMVSWPELSMSITHIITKEISCVYESCLRKSWVYFTKSVKLSKHKWNYGNWLYKMDNKLKVTKNVSL